MAPDAALNEYIGPEISASETATSWGDLAQAEIYASFGEYTRALQSMKHSGISFFTQPVDRVPEAYWHLLFPQPGRFDVYAAVVAVVAFVGLHYRKWPMIPVILGSALLGIAYRWMTGG